MKQSIDVLSNQEKGHHRDGLTEGKTPSLSTTEEMSLMKDSQPTSRQWGRKVFWSAAFVATATVSATVGVSVALVSPLPSIPGFLVADEDVATATESDGSTPEDVQDIPSMLQYKIDRPVNILVMGIDQVPETETGSEESFNGNTDTILVLRFDPTDQTLRMLSIPRDTQVFIPGVGLEKINSANWRGGAETAVEVVSDTLNEIPIDRYVRVTNNAFRELVDLVGGIEVFVPYDMDYEDKTQDLKINLSKGLQTLDGDEAEQFARFRMDDYGDIGRVQRQQVLLKALRERLQSPSVLPLLPKAVQMMLKYVDTNLSMEEMLALVNFAMSLEKESIKMVLLPGRFGDPEEFEGKSYWLMSYRGRDRVVSEFFDHDGDYAVVDDRTQEELTYVRIALQNATRDPDLLDKATEYLSQQEFSNLYITERPAPRTLSKTQIIVQQGDIEAAKALRKVLGFGEIVSDSTGDLGSDITLQLGKDWSDNIEDEELESLDETENEAVEEEELKTSQIEASNVVNEEETLE